MTSRARTARAVTLLVAAVAAGVLLPAFVGTAYAAQSAEGNLSVTITDDTTPTPTPSSTAPAPGSSGGGSPGGGGSSGGGASTAGGGAGGPGGAGGSAGGDEVSVAGMLYVGGLTAETALSPDPGQGFVTLTFRVRNAAQSPVDASARFRLTSAVFGNELDAVEDVPIAGLAPGETRVVTAQLSHAGQWTVLTGHMTFTPPDAVDGVGMSPVTRETQIFLFPWLGAAVVVFVATGAILLPRLLRGFVPARAVASSA